MKTIITHNGSFHTDEVFAIALFLLAFPNEEWQVIRTRETDLLGSADCVIDVGGIYDPKNRRFDHHQEGGAGERQNGILYASFGLVWKEYGLALCGGVEKAFQSIDTNLVAPIDAHDNGIAITTNLYKDIYPYTIGRFFSSFLPVSNGKKEDIDKAFFTVLKVAKDIISREISRAIEYVTLERIVEDIYQKSGDRKIIVFEENYPWQEVLRKYPEPIFVVAPRGDDSNWSVKSINTENGSFKARKLMPAEWAGKKSEELGTISGVDDAVFCHNGRFIAVAKSKEGAIALAKKALES